MFCSRYVDVRRVNQSGSQHAFGNLALTFLFKIEPLFGPRSTGAQMTATVISLQSKRPQLGRIPPEDAKSSMLVELRRARIRIAQLEACLTKAMRDSLVNFDRARDAERRLEELASRVGTP